MPVLPSNEEETRRGVGARRIEKRALEVADNFAPGKCAQANQMADMFPMGVDLDRDPNKALAAWDAAAAQGMDLVFAALIVPMVEETLVEFRDLCLGQLRAYIDGEPPIVLGSAREGTWEHKVARWYLTWATATKPALIYRLSVAVRKAASHFDESSGDVKAAQLVYWRRKVVRLAAGETGPLLGNA